MAHWKNIIKERRRNMWVKRNFIEISLCGVLSFLKESVFADEFALKKGFLQSWASRPKAAFFLFLILSVLLARDIRVIAGLYGLCLVLAFVSRIPVGYFLMRTWIFIPLFSFFIAIPAIFSVFTPGVALATWSIFGIELTVTRQGVWGAGVFVARVATSVSLVVLLTLTTQRAFLLKTLRALGVPAVFVMTLGMCYRYIFLFMTVIEHTYLALKSRVGTRVRRGKGRRVVAWNIASLWQRSYRLHEEVYQAMLSRGYRGEA
jgi:cobalt/nickel transport system permease protein